MSALRLRSKLSLVTLLAFVVSGGIHAQEPSVAAPEFVNIATTDGIALAGAFWKSNAPAVAGLGFLITGGSTTEFYQYAPWAERFAAAGFPSLSLNRRDHGTRFGFEPIARSSLDLRYGMDAFAARGIRDVVLIGHSYGTIAASYYAAVAKDARVKAVVLLAPLADLRAATIRILGGQGPYDGAVATAREMVKAGKGVGIYVMPSVVGDGAPTIHTYSTFLTNRGPDSEAVPAELLKRTGNLPVLAVRDPDDVFPGTLPPAQSQLEAANKRLRYVLLPKSSDMRRPAFAVHGFANRQGEVVNEIVAWLRETGLTSVRTWPGAVRITMGATSAAGNP